MTIQPASPGHFIRNMLVPNAFKAPENIVYHREEEPESEQLRKSGSGTALSNITNKAVHQSTASWK